MAMIVQHYRKIKTGAGLRNVAAHNQRDKIYDDDGNLVKNPDLFDKWIHPEYQIENHHTHKDEKTTVLERRSEAIKLANLVRKPQKNAAFAIEAVYSFSPDFCSDWANNPASMKKIRAFFSGSSKFVRDKFGASNVLQMDIHFDEKTPHMHVLMTPIIMNAKGEKVYSSSAFLGGRSGLRELQSEFADEIGKVFGLERGVEGSKARHTDQAEWSAELKKKERELKGREDAVVGRENAVETREAAVGIREKTVEKLIKNHPDGAIVKELTSRLYGLSQEETNACWYAMQSRADELRSSHYQVKAMAPQSELKKGKGRA